MLQLLQDSMQNTELLSYDLHLELQSQIGQRNSQNERNTE